MKIPILLQTEINQFVEALRAGQNYEPKVASISDEAALDEVLVEKFVSDALSILKSCTGGITKTKEKKTENLELQLTDLALDFFEKLPHAAKFEPGFWSYLSFRLATIIVWRYPPNEKEGWGRNFLVKHAASEFPDGFLPRIILRGQIASGSNEAEAFIQQDFWRSHILRVKTGYSQTMSQSFAEKVIRNRSLVEEQRQVAKKIRSLRSNIIFELLDKTDCDSLVDSSYNT